MRMISGISTERDLPVTEQRIGTFFALRLVAISGASAAIGPPSPPLKMASSAAVCRSSARSSM
jgi:hypothetical protein